jgi:hypothetical protein
MLGSSGSGRGPLALLSQSRRNERMNSNPGYSRLAIRGPNRVSARGLNAALSELSIPAFVMIVCVIHVALLISQAYVSQINDDGILYIQAARLFSEGHSSEARALYPWFSYTFLVGKIMAATGIDALPIARLLNGLASSLTALVILRSAWVSLPQRATLVCAALLLLGNVWFNDLRAIIVREHLYFLFVIVGYYCLLRDLHTPRHIYKIGFGISTLIAGLFRIEALGFLVVVPLLRLIFETRSRSLRAIALTALCVLPLAGIFLLACWNASGSITSLLAGPQARIDIFRDQILWPFEVRKATLAYCSMIAGLVIYGLVNSIGLTTVVLVGFGASMSGAARRSAPFYLGTLYVVVGAVILSAQTFFNIVFDPRHGLILSLVLTVPAAVVLANLLPTIRDESQRLPRIMFGFVIVMSIIGFFAGTRFYDSQRYRFAAGQWLSANFPKHSRVLSNTNHVLFYGGFVNDQRLAILARGASRILDLSGIQDWKVYDFVVLSLRQDQLFQMPNLEKTIGQPPLKSFENGRGDKILVYKTR